ncbi:MAG: HEPN domain-containing protein [Chloroflexota bacterium]
MALETTPEPPGMRDARRWLRQARHDARDAEWAAESGKHSLACFLCHQCAEKSVTAFLLWHGAEGVWGHALADLCEDAMAFDPSFDLIKSVAVLLDRHYEGARYPSTLPGGVPAEAYDGHDSERALEIARDTLDFVTQRVESGE